MAVTKFGGYSEALIAPQEHVFQLPRDMTLQEAAAFHRGPVSGNYLAIP
jgi:NADPH:quinone reductase-like Zn-dependent oxidoreductase